MSDSYWKIKTEPLPRQKIVWPNLKQILSQLVMMIVAVMLWSLLLLGYLQWRTPPPEVAAIVIKPTPTATTPPTATATLTSVPTNTPVPSHTPAPSLTADEGKTPQTTADDTPSETPTPAPSQTPTAIPTATVPPTATPQPPPHTPAPNVETVGPSFANDVLPIIERRCTKCHGDGFNDDGTLRVEEGLYLISYSDIISGSLNGPVIAPGSAADSYLVELIESGDMPESGPHLLPAQIRLIKAWIDAGAVDN